MAKIAKKSQNLKKSAVTSKESIVKEEKDNFGSSMNEPEVRSAKKADEVEVNEATVKRLNLLLGIVSKKFNLDDTYTVKQFNDKGKVINITLENDEVKVAVTVKDSERHGLVVE